jgi:hypothetical protein
MQLLVKGRHMVPLDLALPDGIPLVRARPECRLSTAADAEG